MTVTGREIRNRDVGAIRERPRSSAIGGAGGPNEDVSSEIPRVEDLLEITSDTCAQTEFVTNSAWVGGAVNRPFTFILKNLSDPSDADPCLAGLLIETFAFRCDGEIFRIRRARICSFVRYTTGLLPIVCTKTRIKD